ncbi:MAG: hypothetical protein RLZZ214_2614 [Verrucomicrobiota bacterium]
MLNARNIQGIIILTLGTILAVWLGLSIATNQVETILQVIMAVVLITCLALGRRIWLLIPFTIALDITFRLPGLPSSALLGQILVLAFSLLLFLMRKLPFRLAWTELEFWILVMTLFVVQVYLRNPIGVNVFGGDTVGGRPYALFAVALATALLLTGLKVPINDLKMMLRMSIAAGILNVAVSILGTFVPTVGYYTGNSFARTDEPNYENIGVAVDERAATRINWLASFSKNAALWVSSFISPLKAFVRPLWCALLILSLAAAAMSGFRNTVFSVILIYTLAIAYRGGLASLMVSGLMAVGALTIITLVNSLAPLPPNIQRSLSFLPGNWEEKQREQSKESSDWRMEIWKEALTSERWIRNKWMGDGLGFSAAELAGQMNARKGVRSGLSGMDAHRETILVNGDYHSGPVSTIRVIGGIGLLFFLLAQIRLAVHTHRQIMRCRGTEWFPLALYIGIPVICAPIMFVFIFGDFKTSGALFLISCGMIRLLENNLPLPAYVSRSRMPYMLSSRQNTSQVAEGFSANRAG